MSVNLNIANMTAELENGMRSAIQKYGVELTKELAKTFGFDVKEALKIADSFIKKDSLEVDVPAKKKKVARKEKAVETEEHKKMIAEKAEEVMKVMGLKIASAPEPVAEKKKVVRKGKTKEEPLPEENSVLKDDSVLTQELTQEPVNEELEDEICMKDIDGKHYYVNESNGIIYEVAGDCEAGPAVGVYKDGTPVFNKKEEEVPKKKKASVKKP